MDLLSLYLLKLGSIDSGLDLACPCLHSFPDQLSEGQMPLLFKRQLLLSAVNF